ncbi:MAG: FAD-binding oxidoreductase [Gammaproteobacteria bacterium]|nr:FAD-binding oxidoreductase [Gammaproteobacteria bacterium]
MSKLKTLYDASMYDSRPVPSYWEATAGSTAQNYDPLQTDESCDIAIIGGGYTGLSAALHLARDYSIDVRVLEAGHIGWGASGRNGGFCCIPASKMSIEQMIGKFGLEETKRFYTAQIDGTELTRNLSIEENIDCDIVGDGNMNVAHAPNRFDEIKQEAQQLNNLFGIKTTLYSKDEFAEIGHDSTEQYGALHMQVGFALHPLKLTQGLGQAATRHGAKLHPHSFVSAWNKNDSWHELVTRDGTLRARQVLVATNGFTREGLHAQFDNIMLPAISNIIVTRPLNDNELQAQSWHTENPICNTRALLFYYRMLPDKRFLFGARGDTTGKVRDGEKMKRWMVKRLGEVFPAWKAVDIEYFWRGLVCVTRKLTPSVGNLNDDPSIWYGFGYHANGVNTAPWCGMKLASAIAGKEDIDKLPTPICGLAPRFPIGSMRPWALRGAYAWYKFTDDR